VDSRYLILYIAGVGAALIFFLSISYWSVNFFIKQISERTYERFREHLAREVELAIKLFREGLCEQIVHQESKSDSLAKLYATLIDQMRVGKEFTTGLGSGDLPLAEKRLRTVRELFCGFSEMYQKQSLHFSKDFCTLLDGFLAEQKAVMEYVETHWGAASGKEPPDKSKSEELIKQRWLQFEDRIGSVMDTLRNEFRRRQPAPANIMMKWLNEVPAPKEITSPTTKT
jgi:tRNA nucleotidyltransferase/poly(A) polymerase